MNFHVINEMFCICQILEENIVQCDSTQSVDIKKGLT